MLVEAENRIWQNINVNIAYMWPSIQITFEQEEIVQIVKTTIQNIEPDLEHRPEEAQRIITLLNSNTKDELEDVNIPDRTQTTMEVKRVLSKNNLMIQLEKCKELELQVRRFNRKFTLMQEKGLPTPRNSNGK